MGTIHPVLVAEGWNPDNVKPSTTKGCGEMAVIQVEQVRKTFGARDALTEVSFSIPKGEIFGFLGPSGAGKTTLIKILTAQLKPTDGAAKVFDQPAEAMQQSVQKMRFGILTDNSGLYERLSIEENLELYRKLYDLPALRWIRCCSSLI